MIIKHNLLAANTNRNLNINTNKVDKAFQRLSSGFRINKAGDDAAGLTMSEKMRGQIKGLEKVNSNVRNAFNMLQTAEGGMEEIENMVHRIRELSVQSANDTNTDSDRDMIQLEIEELIYEIDRIACDTEFNTIPVLNGSEPVRTNNPVTIYKNYIDDTITKDYFQNKSVYPTYNGSNFFIGGESLNNFILDNYIKNVWKGGKDFGDFIKNDLYDADGNCDIGAFKIFAQTIMDAFNNYIDGVNKVNESNIPYVATYVDVEAITNRPYFALGGLNGDNIIFGGCSVATGSLGHDFLHMTGSSGNSDVEREFRYTFNVQSGANSGQSQLYSIRSMRAAFIGIRSADVSTRGLSEITIGNCDKAIAMISKSRSECGVIMNRLEHQEANADNSQENMQVAEALIRDTDIATEMVDLAKFQIICQSAQAMLAQANSLPNNILKLLG